jgi:AcrR family transcriptional regulator
MIRRRPARPARRGPGRPPGPSQAPHQRVRLIEEASRLYAEGGYAGLSFASVAARAGLTKATVFHYFPNKEALLLAVFEAFGERLERAAESWFDPSPASHAARLDRLVASLVDFYGREPLNARILCHGLLEGERFAAGRRRGTPPTATQRFVARFADFIADGIAAAEFHPARPLAVVMAIGGIILFELMLPDQGAAFRAGRDGPVGLDVRAREMADVIARAVVRPQARLRRARTAERREVP